MRFVELIKSVDQNQIGHDMYTLVEALYPLCRSITGNGVRQTFRILEKTIPLEIHEIPSGTKVFDWEVPREWNIRDAYIKAPNGDKIIDFQKNNLHVLNYSSPIRKELPLTELKEHLYTSPEHPEWIPYRTTYYNEAWGFCLPHNQMLDLPDGKYEVLIDSTLEEGALTYGEYFIEGATPDEILLFCHTCHPSLCNDNLSGIALVTHLAQYLSQHSLRYSYRFVFAPATIGSITWLARNQERLQNIRYGLVASVLGDVGCMHYKKTRNGNTEIDRAVIHTLASTCSQHEILDFIPYGYDERQFCSPGIDLAVGRLTRTPNGCYPEYHTSADNLDLVNPSALGESFFVYLKSINLLENNFTFVNQNPKCEPQLGRRGLYRTKGGYQDIGNWELAMLWTLNLSDGNHSLLDIAERSGLDFAALQNAATDLLAHGLLARTEKNTRELSTR